MCGIVGILNLSPGPPVGEETIRRMLSAIRHRGPDQFGVLLDEGVGLGNARLSIVDLKHGQQPIPNEDGTRWIMFNGEIFNHEALRKELEAKGHRFSTNCDTETVLHAYEEFGADCVSRFNGQFVFSIWDTRKRSLFIARDRLGVRPLFYTVIDGALIFGSEIKAILADPRVPARLDLVALEQTFTYWSPLSPRTAFQGIVSLPPGHHLSVLDGRVQQACYWKPAYPQEDAYPARNWQECVEEFQALLVDATRCRLRADVPVGAYLSGGLDSSTIAAIIRTQTDTPLDTFSISFSDPEFDESIHQRQMAQVLGTQHHVVHATHEDIGRIFPETVWHCEATLMRTSPAPMFLLSKLVQDRGFKVVLTGEGADEILAGYDIFKEAKVRRFWARLPESRLRPELFKRIYPWISGLASSQASYLAAFFGKDLADTASPSYSHAIRWRTTSRAKRFFDAGVQSSIEALNVEEPDIPEAFRGWDPLCQAEYLELTIFLSQYLLSSQGDRMGMAHSVEGRFPFLDHRVVDFCSRLPATMKLRGLTEKHLLKQAGRKWLPEEVCARPKQPFRAPIHRAFFHSRPLEYVEELLSPGSIAGTGLFNPAAVEQLTRKLRQGLPLGETDDMALVGILSTQLLDRMFISHRPVPSGLGADDDVKVVALGHDLQGAHP